MDNTVLGGENRTVIGKTEYIVSTFFKEKDAPTFNELWTKYLTDCVNESIRNNSAKA
ncbi:MAG: hypothetical protein LBN27_05010 [Prevotellaceae bacterium]|jgi:hypothetical protein|nr:hypothetical protein [Prevotellaceae bacterium]